MHQEQFVSRAPPSPAVGAQRIRGFAFMCYINLLLTIDIDSALPNPVVGLGRVRRKVCRRKESKLETEAEKRGYLGKRGGHRMEG